MRQLSDILQELIPKKGKSKSEVARLLGISSQLLGQYQRGGRKPGGDFFLKWRQVFGEDLLKLIETGVSDNGAASDPLPGSVTIQDHISTLKQWREDAERKYQDARAEKLALIQIINDYLKIIEKSISDVGISLTQGQKDMTDLLRITTTQLEDQRVMLSQGLSGERPVPVSQPLKKDRGAHGKKLSDGKKDKDS